MMWPISNDNYRDQSELFTFLYNNILVFNQRERAYEDMMSIGQTKKTKNYHRH